jgi:hypothetical protein
MNTVVWSAETDVDVITGSRCRFAISEPGITATIVTIWENANLTGLASFRVSHEAQLVPTASPRTHKRNPGPDFSLLQLAARRKNHFLSRDCTRSGMD